MLARTPYHAKHVPLPDSSPSSAATWLKPAGTRVGDNASDVNRHGAYGSTRSPQPDAQWWITLAQRLHIKDKVEQFFHDATTPHNVLDRVAEVDGDMQYILFVLVRHWIPIVLPPPGRERVAKHDPDYWLESAQILECRGDAPA